VFRLLAHPRFRAAFDFLELRLSGAPEVAEDVAFWREAQIESPELLAERLGSSKPPRGEGEPSSAMPPKKRRRRRKPPRAAGAPEVGAADNSAPETGASE